MAKIARRVAGLEDSDPNNQHELKSDVKEKRWKLVSDLAQAMKKAGPKLEEAVSKKDMALLNGPEMKDFERLLDELQEIK